MDNQTIARRLSEHARMETNIYKARAYRYAAEWIQTFDRPLADVLEKEGRAGLAALPFIGTHLAYTIEGLLRTGEFRLWKDRARQTLPAAVRRG